MPTLNQTQMNSLQAKITAGNISGFYAELESYGDGYGRLGGAVTNNDSWQGVLANAFAASGASDDSVVLTHGSTAWEALNADLAARYLARYAANNGVTPDWEQIQTLHNDAYDAAGLDADDWLPNKLLNDSADPAALWADYVTNTGAADLWDDAFDVAGAGAGLAIPPAFAVNLLTDPDFMNKVLFAKNFYDALAAMDKPTLQDMVGDFTGNSVVSDLLNFIIDLPAIAGGLWAKLPDLGDIAPKALPGWVPGVTVPYGQAENTASPIVLDVDMSGTIELAALNGAGSVYWDSGDGDEFREASGWITGGDGLLCVVGGNGVVDGKVELFGDDSTYANGYLKLDALYDTNSDNVITSADTNFGDLRVWVDSNADGYSQSGELFTLSALEITSISTAYSTVNYEIAGNAIKQESTFTMAGNSYQSVDAWFAYDNVNSEFSGSYTLDPRVLFLPTLRGYGTLPDLHIAMSLDETLLEMVEALAVKTASELLNPDFEIRTAFREILFRWIVSHGVV